MAQLQAEDLCRTLQREDRDLSTTVLGTTFFFNVLSYLILTAALLDSHYYHPILRTSPGTHSQQGLWIQTLSSYLSHYLLAFAQKERERERFALLLGLEKPLLFTR